jgi:hypothetical protein
MPKIQLSYHKALRDNSTFVEGAGLYYDLLS